MNKHLPKIFLILSGTLLLNACAAHPEQRPHETDYSRDPKNPITSPRKLCVFMDGTANDYDSHTNVRRLYELISTRRDPKQLCYYDQGVGSNQLPLSGMIGGAGFTKNLSQAYAFLARNYERERGDKIYIFGFSRGARQAQILCDILDECGLATPATGNSFRAEESRARTMIREYKRHIVDRRKGRAAPPMHQRTGWYRPEIEFVGIFDCVESMANNVWAGLSSGSLKNGDYKDHRHYIYDLPEIVKEAYHAMAVDESRGLYEVIKWVVPSDPPPGQILEQVWFPGTHGDVGGGYTRSQSLAGISLNWMLGKLKPHRLAPAEIRVHTDNKTPVTPSLEFFLPGKVLSKIRNPIARGKHFWFDRVQNSKFPDSHEKARLEETRPLVHESLIARMRFSFPDVAGDSLELHGRYRPDVFNVAATGKWEDPKWPGRTFYSSHPKNGDSTVDFDALKSDVRIMTTAP